MIHDHCGVGLAHSLDDILIMGEGLQHRGREAAGIVCIGDRIDVVKWRGEVNQIGLKFLQTLLNESDYHTFGIHVRYATKGSKDTILDDAHPHVKGGTIEEYPNHTIIWDVENATLHNGQINPDFLDCGGCDTESVNDYLFENGPHAFLKNIPGSYTLIYADKKSKAVAVLRDRHGFMPGVKGNKNGRGIFASEDVAIRAIDSEVEGEIRPGSLSYFWPDGHIEARHVVEPNRAHCFFQHNYLGHVDSVLNRVSVREIRRAHGIRLAEVFGDFNADYVTWVPSCPEPAASAFSEITGVPMLKMMYKLKLERAFQGSTQEDRAESIKTNLFPLTRVRNKVRDKKIIIIEDSTIRANNIKRVKYITDVLGVGKAILLNYTSKLCGTVDGVHRGCFMGVDMPPVPYEGEDYIARGRTDDQISAKVGMETHFLSVPDMLMSFDRLGLLSNELCYYCVGGPNPYKRNQN